MNREEQIAKFRQEMLSKYIKYASEPITKIISKAEVYKTNLRQCSRCGEWLPVSEYYGSHIACKKCENIQNYERTKRNKIS